MIDVFLGVTMAIALSSIIFFLLWWFNIFDMLFKKKRMHNMVKTLKDIHKDHVKEKKKNDKQRDSKHTTKKNVIKT